MALLDRIAAPGGMKDLTYLWLSNGYFLFTGYQVQTLIRWKAWMMWMVSDAI